MTSPFRSELEQLQEQVRRAEEKTRDAETRADTLVREKLALRHQLSSGRRPYLFALGMVVAGVVVLSAILIGSMRVEVARANAAAEATRMTSEMRIREAENCAIPSAQLALCQTDLRTCQATKAPPSPPTSCTCAPGDPLCACGGATPEKAFDRGAAAAALGNATRALESCITPRREVSFHTRLTFNDSGRVTDASVDADSILEGNAGNAGNGAALSPAERKCVTDRLKTTVSVPSFTGGPTTVGKSFHISPSPRALP